MSLLDLLSGPHDAAKKVPGVVIGIVVAVDEATARVKLKFPVLNEEDESDWARIVVLMAGDQAGAYCLPEVGDEALCAFEHGDIRYPYVLGFLWGKDKPPEAKRQKRLIQSRSGHKILLDDTDGAAAITITTPAGMSIKLEDQPGSATIATKSGVSVKLSDAPPGLTIDASAAGKVAITCLQADVTAPAGVTFNTPKATFAGMISALMVQTQVLQSQAVISPSYTPGAGNIL